MEEHLRRTAIDRLRVALSRATEALAFIEVSDPSTPAVAASRNLLGAATQFEADDLVEHLSDTETTAEERVGFRLEEAGSLMGDRPARAWSRAGQAVSMLGDPTLPNGVADRELRRRAHTTLLAVAARLLVEGIPPGVEREGVVEAARASGRELGAGDDQQAGQSVSNAAAAAGHALDELVAWSGAADRAAASPFALLNAVAALADNGDWLRGAVVGSQQTLRGAIERQAAMREGAGHLDGAVETWLRVTGYAGDADAEARRLRIEAVKTLIPVEPDAADRVLQKVAPGDDGLLGQVREAQGRFEEAAKAFANAGRRKDTLRAWRRAGRWDRAADLATGRERDDLDWLVTLARTLAQRPQQLQQRLTPAERKRLESLASAIASDAAAATVALAVDAREGENPGADSASRPASQGVGQKRGRKDQGEQVM